MVISSGVDEYWSSGAMEHGKNRLDGSSRMDQRVFRSVSFRVFRVIRVLFLRAYIRSYEGIPSAS